MQPSGVGYGYPPPMQPPQTTTVVVGQAAAIAGMGAPQQGMRYDLSGVRDFTHGLCDCFDDCGSCMIDWNMTFSFICHGYL